MADQKFLSYHDMVEAMISAFENFDRTSTPSNDFEKLVMFAMENNLDMDKIVDFLKRTDVFDGNHLDEPNRQETDDFDEFDEETDDLPSFLVDIYEVYPDSEMRRVLDFVCALFILKLEISPSDFAIMIHMAYSQIGGRSRAGLRDYFQARNGQLRYQGKIYSMINLACQCRKFDLLFDFYKENLHAHIYHQLLNMPDDDGTLPIDHYLAADPAERRPHEANIHHLLPMWQPRYHHLFDSITKSRISKFMDCMYFTFDKTHLPRELAFVIFQYL